MAFDTTLYETVARAAPAGGLTLHGRSRPTCGWGVTLTGLVATDLRVGVTLLGPVATDLRVGGDPVRAGRDRPAGGE